MLESTQDYIESLERMRKIELLRSAFDRLTNRESQTVSLLVCGLSNKEIARQLKITEGAVKVRLKTVSKKLGSGHRTLNRIKIAILAIRYGGFTVNGSLLSYIK